MVVSDKMIFINTQRALIEQLRSIEHSGLQNPTRRWDISDPKLHYVSLEQAEEYLSLQKNSSYSTGMHAQEIALLQKSSPLIISKLPESFNYIDFGPGSGDKSKILLQEAKRQGKHVSYCGIDISEKILSYAMSEIAQLDIHVQGFVGDFIENLSDINNSLDDETRFVYFGATFGNWDPGVILAKLNNFMLPSLWGRTPLSAQVYVSSQCRSDDIESILAQYRGLENMSLFSQSLQQLGFSKDDLEYGVRLNEKSQMLECYAKILQVSSLLDRRCPGMVLSGDEFIHSMTLKPTKEYFERIFKGHFDKVDHYSSDSFLAAVIHN